MFIVWSDSKSTEIYGVPLWGWILTTIAFAIVLILIISVLMSDSKKKNKSTVDSEAAIGNIEDGGAGMPKVSPPLSPEPAPEVFQRDKALPPPVPSVTSETRQ